MKQLLKKGGIFSLICIFPLSVYAQGNTPGSLIDQMQTLLDKYSEKIRVLESENALLRATMAKYEIQIPLEEYNQVIFGTGTVQSVIQAIGQTTVNTPKVAYKNPENTQTPTTTISASEDSRTPLESGFITQIQKDWPAIRNAYSLPADARLGAYEFVVGVPERNVVFADIIYGTGTVDGAWNAKLLYNFDTKTFKRKLIGFFEYNPASKGYITHRGTNPYAGVERKIIRENAFAQPSAPAVVTPIVTPTSSVPTDVENRLQEAYQKKDWSALTKISEDFLKNNAPTYRVILYRYRMFFLKREFDNALAEIKKLENAKLATPLVYCDAYAIAQYA